MKQSTDWIAKGGLTCRLNCRKTDRQETKASSPAPTFPSHPSTAGCNLTEVPCLPLGSKFGFFCILSSRRVDSQDAELQGNAPRRSIVRGASLVLLNPQQAPL